MSHVGSSIESLFAAGAAASESPKMSMAPFVTSVVDTIVAPASLPLVVATGALGAGAVAVVGDRLLESLATRFGAPATITVCGCGVVAGCE